ncbi:Leucine rich repeat containing protein BspA family protein [Entamoeba marina]
MIASKYLIHEQDFINLVCTCSKHKHLLDQFHFNPISVETKKLFPRMETQHLFKLTDKIIEGLFQYVVWFTVDYETVIEEKRNNIKYKNVVFSWNDRYKWEKNSQTQTIQKESLLKDKQLSKATLIKGTQFDAFQTTMLAQLPTCISHIGEYCFFKCSKLKNISISSSIKTVGGNCFCGCSNLTSLTLPSSLSSIGSGCFSECLNLKNITINNCKQFNGLVPYWISLILQKNCITCLNVQFTKDDIVPWENSHPDDIGDDGKLKRITVESIGSKCFSECSSLEAVELPFSSKEIPSNCFYGCANLTSVVIPNSITALRDGCFSKCFKLATIILPENLCTNLSTITIPPLVTNIESACFYGCFNLTKIVFPDGLKEIGPNCFGDCYNLEYVNIPSGITNLSQNFLGCHKLNSLELNVINNCK